MSAFRWVAVVFVVVCLIGGCAQAPRSVPPAEGKRFDHPGGMHSADEIRWVTANLDREPWRSAYAQLKVEADSRLGDASCAVEDFNVPYYYRFPEACMAAKRGLSENAGAAYALALTYRLDTAPQRSRYADKAVTLLTDWGKTNRRASGYDGDLVMCYAGLPFIFAGDLLWDYHGWSQEDRETFMRWVREVFLRSAKRKETERNNHGDWGTFASIAAHHLVDDRAGVLRDVAHLKRRIATSIGANGELPAETKRNNSGMWYTYFALAPMTGAVQIARNATAIDLFAYEAPGKRSVRQALDAFFVYCQNPEAWPYARKTGIAGALQEVFYPSADTIKLPSPSSWPGNLYEAMGAMYGEATWTDYVKAHRPIRGGRAWIYPTLMSVPQESR